MTIGDLWSLTAQVPAASSMMLGSLVGKALVDAYDLERDKEWSGAIVSDEFIEEFQEHVRRLIDTPGLDTSELATLDYLVEQGLLLRYPVPGKNSEGVEHWTIGWPNYNPDRPGNELVRAAFASHGKDPEPAAAKIENTLAYLTIARPGPQRGPRS